VITEATIPHESMEGAGVDEVLLCESNKKGKYSVMINHLTSCVGYYGTV